MGGPAAGTQPVMPPVNEATVAAHGFYGTGPLALLWSVHCADPLYVRLVLVLCSVCVFHTHAPPRYRPLVDPPGGVWVTATRGGESEGISPLEESPRV